MSNVTQTCSGSRFASHGWEAILGGEDAESEEAQAKVARIRDIRSAGFEPEIWIIRHGMNSKAEYTAVEAACIDLLQSMPIRPIAEGALRVPGGCKNQLTNARREASRGHGIMLLQDLYDEKAAPPLETDIPLLLVALGPWTENPDEAIPGGYLRQGYGYKSEWLTSSERIKHFQRIGESAAG